MVYCSLRHLLRLCPRQKSSLLITSPLTISANPILAETVSDATILVSDGDGDYLEYTWDVTLGQISGSGNTVLFNAPYVESNTNVTINVTADDGYGGVITDSIDVTVLPNPDAGFKPWSTNENGNLRVNQPWNYTMGYRFTPNKSGQVISLGGYFNGTKSVSLWNAETGELVATTQVVSSNNWSYASINPVDVVAGTQYIVAAYIEASGGSYRSGINRFPQTYGDITINNAMYAYGNARPTNAVTATIYGQVDIEFQSE